MTHISNNFCRGQALEWDRKPAETEKPGKRLNKNLHIYTWCQIIIKLSLEGTGEYKEMLLKTQIRKGPDKGIYSRDTGTVRTSLHCVDIFVCIFIQERNWEETEKSK